MSTFADFASTIAFTPESFERLTEDLPATWIEQALATEGTAHVRKRKLPREAAIWVPVGMGLFRDRSIHEVVEHLGLVVDDGTGTGVSAGALPAARARVGSAPLKTLFELSAETWSRRFLDNENRWRGLSLWAMDGTCFNLADTDENDEKFGRPRNAKAHGAFPQVRVVALLNARTRILGGLSAGPYRTSEIHLLEPLWEKIPDHSMTLVDRGLHFWWAFHRLNTGGVERHWMTRARSNLAARVVQRLGRGDELVEISISAATRKDYPDAPESITARRVRVTRRGYRPTVLLTSATDPEAYPASELRGVYIHRWEIELSYDELKNHLLDGATSFRSKTAVGVWQELYGVGIAYNLVRVELARLATELRVDPRRMSFQHALQFIRNFMLASWATSPGAIPKRLGSLRAQLRLLLLPPRRPRSFPRQVRRRYSKYRVARARRPISNR